MQRYLGIDCGATYLRIGLLNKSGDILDSQTTRSPLKDNPIQLGQKVKEVIAQKGWAGFVGVGIGTPGPIDSDLGVILPSANLRNTEPIEVVKDLETVLDINICFDRDTNLALLGESWMGEAQGFKDVVMLTLGSGVGGAIMVDGKIDRGKGGKAGEIGHIYIEISNFKFQISNLPKCGLGHEGCLEAMINSTDNLHELGTYLGYGLANIVDIFNPELIIIGGGKVKLGDFLPKAVAVMKQKGIKPSVDEVIVKYAKLGDMSGVVGAAKLAIYD